MTYQRTSLLKKAADMTGWPASILADITGLGKSTVTAYMAGRLEEHLDGFQLTALLNALRLYRDQLDMGISEIEMLT